MQLVRSAAPAGQRVDHRQGEHALDHVVTGGFTQLSLGGGQIQDVVHDLEHHPVGVPTGRECLDMVPRQSGGDTADTGRGRKERGRLTINRGHILIDAAIEFELRGELRDLALHQSADGVAEQPGHLGAQRRRNLRRPGQQEIARQNGPVIAIAGVHRFDTPAHLGIVHDVVVIQRADLHQLDTAPTLNDVVGCHGVIGERCSHRHHRPQTLSARLDEVARQFRQVRVRCGHGPAKGGFDSAKVDVHRWQGEQGGGRCHASYVTQTLPRRRMSCRSAADVWIQPRRLTPRICRLPDTLRSTLFAAKPRSP